MKASSFSSRRCKIYTAAAEGPALIHHRAGNCVKWQQEKSQCCTQQKKPHIIVCDYIWPQIVLKPDRKVAAAGGWSTWTARRCACGGRTLGLLNTTWSGENSAIVRVLWLPVILPVHREPKSASAARLVIICMSPGHAFLTPRGNKSAARPAGKRCGSRDPCGTVRVQTDRMPAGLTSLNGSSFAAMWRELC